MHRATLSKNLEKIRKRLVFTDEATFYTKRTIDKNSETLQSNSRMAQAYVETIKPLDVVFFLGYKNPHNNNKKFFCSSCIDIELGFELLPSEEHKYLYTGEKLLEQFTDDDHRDKSNYCAACEVPLYDLKEECQHSRPTLKKWRNRFKKKKHYGLRGGGI